MNSLWISRVTQFKSDTFGLVSRLLERNFVSSLNFYHSEFYHTKFLPFYQFLPFFEMNCFFNVCWDWPRYPLQKWYGASFQFFSSYQLLIFKSPLLLSIYLNEKYSIWTSFEFSNKNTLTEPVNRKKTTRHHAHLSLCARSRKTNHAKSRKWPKTSIWAIFGRFRGQIFPIYNFFWKIGFIQIVGHI